MGCFSGCLMSSASNQKLFCGIYSAFKCSFDEFVGEKVVSLSYSSAILGPPPPVCFLTLLLLRLLVFFLLIVRHWLGSRHSSPSGSLLWIPLVWCLLALEFFQDPYLETLIPCTPFFFFLPHLQLPDFLDGLCHKSCEVIHNICTVFSSRILLFWGLMAFVAFSVTIMASSIM